MLIFYRLLQPKHHHCHDFIRYKTNVFLYCLIFIPIKRLIANNVFLGFVTAWRFDQLKSRHLYKQWSMECAFSVFDYFYFIAFKYSNLVVPKSIPIIFAIWCVPLVAMFCLLFDMRVNRFFSIWKKIKKLSNSCAFSKAMFVRFIDQP